MVLSSSSSSFSLPLRLCVLPRDAPYALEPKEKNASLKKKKEEEDDEEMKEKAQTSLEKLSSFSRNSCGDLVQKLHGRLPSSVTKAAMAICESRQSAILLLDNESSDERKKKKKR